MLLILPTITKAFATAEGTTATTPARTAIC